MGVCEMAWAKAMLKTVHDEAEFGPWSAGNYKIRSKNTFIEIVPSSGTTSSGASRRSKSHDSRSESPPPVQGCAAPVHEAKCEGLKSSCNSKSPRERLTEAAGLERGRPRAERWSETPGRRYDEEIGKCFPYDCPAMSNANLRVHWRYVHNRDDTGVTVMWHGIPSKCTAERDLLPMLDSIAAHHEYLYLPMNQHSKSHRATKSRNKGYAFVHFGDEASAQAFANRVEQGVALCKKTSTTLAAFQGISANLEQLFAAPQMRTTDSVIYIRHLGRMEQVGVHELASLRTCF